MADYRTEAAIDRMHDWAWITLHGKGHEIEVGYTGESCINDFNMSKGYSPFCFKLKTNATQTRRASKSSLPLGGAAHSQLKNQRYDQIEKLIAENFNERQKLLLFALFLPRSTFGGATDARIAQLCQYPPKRASEVKCLVLRLIILEYLAPAVERVND